MRTFLCLKYLPLTDTSRLRSRFTSWQQKFFIFEQFSISNTFLYPKTTQTRNWQRKSGQIFVCSIKSISDQNNKFSLLEIQKIFYHGTATFSNYCTIFALVKVMHLKKILKNFLYKKKIILTMFLKFKKFLINQGRIAPKLFFTLNMPEHVNGRKEQ